MKKSIIFLFMVLFIMGCTKKEILDQPELKKLNLKKTSVTDIDGNVYNTAEIGPLVWMTKNLRVTTLNDGTSLPIVTSSNLNSPGYVEEPSLIGDSPARRYNLYAIKTGKLAPMGWHVANMEDWRFITKYGVKDVVIPSNLWNPPIPDASNSTAFSALPGQRYWWNPLFPIPSFPNTSSSITILFYHPSWDWYGFALESDETCSAVRCVKDREPIVSTMDVTEITSTSAKITGGLLNKGGLLLDESGFCISTHKKPTIKNDKVIKELYYYSVEAVFEGLKPNTTYFATAFATNPLGTGYGEVISFTTAP